MREMSRPSLADLESLERGGLVALWAELFGPPTPKSISQPMLRRILGFELQARRLGGLSRPTLRQLAATATVPAKPRSARLRPGGHLIRDWAGVSHVVDVTAEGYLWQGRSYRSLFAIAKAITGAHWSGPRFFGTGETTTRTQAARR